MKGCKSLEPSRSNLITRENILDRFSQNLEWATEIDLATAWATPNESLYALQRRTPRPTVRAVVGTGDNLTKAGALKTLYCIGQLGAAVESRLFHPKVYIFRDVDRVVAWIGSANFTAGGFERNEEVLFETSDTKAVEGWFKQLWEQCYLLTKSDIDNYESHQREYLSPQRSNMWVPPMSENPPPIWFLDEVDDWSSYVVALKRCNWWWKRRTKKRDRKSQFSILETKRSYLHTICAGRKVSQLPNWGNLTRCECNILRGQDDEQGVWGLVGSLRASRRVSRVFIPENMPDVGPVRERIHNHVKQVLTAPDCEIARVAHGVVQEIVSDKVGPFKGFGPASATRLLALARPDRLVSVNSKSATGLGKLISGRSKSPEWLANHYDRLLKWVHDQDWFKAKKPENCSVRQRKIWNCRVALLDAFVYDED